MGAGRSVIFAASMRPASMVVIAAAGPTLLPGTGYNFSMPAVSLDSRVSISEDAVFRELGGESVIVHLDSGIYYGLDPVGTRVWQLIDAHGQLKPVFEAALDEFDVEPARLEEDLLRLVTELASRRLVVVR
jgi:hypothetical protein